MSAGTRMIGMALTASVLAAAAAGCGGDPEEGAPDATTEATTTTSPDPADPPAVGSDHGRVVALAEEFLLADLLALGVTPVASSATVSAAGFQGLDPADTEGIEVLSMTELNLEQVAALDPDTVVTLQFWVDQVGEEVLTGLGELVVVPDGLTAEEQIRELGELLDRPDEAATILEQLAEARSAAAAAIDDDCVVTLATIYAGPNVAAYVEPTWPLPRAIVDAGCTLDPGIDDAAPDRNGRAFLSTEQLGLLDGPTMVLFQSSAVEGEDTAIEAVEAEPLWATLPAVADDRVLVFDRLGYPGARGQIRFLDDFAAAIR